MVGLGPMERKVWDITEKAALAGMAREVAALAEGSGAALRERAAVIGLSGDLGAGKTTFAQTLAFELGVREPVTSPTFVIMKQYRLPAGGGFDTLVHIDAYRVESPEELRVLGFDDLLADGRNLICVEWAEKVEELLPTDSVRLRFLLSADSRTVALTE